MSLIRLQKYIADAGLASRREAEQWIADGRVKVNGRSVTTQGTKVDPAKDQISVDGRKVLIDQRPAYYLFYKPKNVMVTRHDPQGRPTIFEYLKKIPERVFPVGRLDFDSEGLLLLTNDGALTHRLTHPRSKVPKVYSVEVDRNPDEDQLKRLKGGIDLEEGRGTIASLSLKADRSLEITLTEGKRRQIRRMLEAVGLEVLRLKRIQIGPFSLGRLAPGQWRPIQVKPPPVRP